MVNIPKNLKNDIISKLRTLYGNQARKIFSELEKVLFEYYEILFQQRRNSTNIKYDKKFGHQDIILNLYADSIQEEHNTPLQVLYRFSDRFLKGVIDGAHILPFFPWDTDRGFSILNYYEVDPRNGSWEDFTALNKVFDKLMIDCVINHASIDNPIVQKALIGDPDFTDFVVTYTDETKPSQNDLLRITRARPSPVLTRYYVFNDRNKKKWASFDKQPEETVVIKKTGWVWTTFSRPDRPDGTVATRQVDFNFKNPKVFLEFVKIMLFYVSKGARWLRLDAVGYLWKKIGTTCLHLQETHILIQIFVDIFKILDHLQIVLIAEVNEPQEKALQYLGTKNLAGTDMIYLFTHYPLAVHAVLTGSAKYYMNWIPSLINARGRLFISVLGTHDGMGMKPIGKWLPETEKRRLEKILIEKHGALPNYATLPRGEKIIYELCATSWNFINEVETDEPLILQIERYLAVFALGLTIKGVPSIYINGLLGIPNYERELVENRTINRQILDENQLNERLSDSNSQMYQIFSKMMNLIKIRRKEKAFDPEGEMLTYSLNEAVVSVLVSSYNDTEKIFAMINVSGETQQISIDVERLGVETDTMLRDVITDLYCEINPQTRFLELKLEPYQICWLKIIN